MYQRSCGVSSGMSLNHYRPATMYDKHDQWCDSKAIETTLDLYKHRDSIRGGGGGGGGGWEKKGIYGHTVLKAFLPCSG